MYISGIINKNTILYMKDGYNYVVSLNDLLIKANIGVTAAEREIPQDIKISFKLLFNKMPKACETDDIADTVCYHEIAQIALSHCNNEKVKLLECLCFGLYKKIRNVVASDIKIWIKTEKCNPPIEGMLGGTCFEYSDF